jgi:hypothetical protein
MIGRGVVEEQEATILRLRSCSLREGRLRSQAEEGEVEGPEKARARKEGSAGGSRDVAIARRLYAAAEQY